MNDIVFNSKVKTAAKWSYITEILIKLVSPITTMILARLILPESFGIIASVIMIISFADMFTDSGFQKYLVQHEFKDLEEKNRYANVAFWTNLSISFVLWAILLIFRNYISSSIGIKGYGLVIAIAGMQLPLTAFSSIQLAIMRRDFDFKKIFYVKIVTIFVPIFITIPLAILNFEYWSLVIGSICVQFAYILVIIFKSEYKISFYYNFKILKQMFSFSIWSLIEAISIWLTVWIDVFIIAKFISIYNLGLYKTSTTMINTIMSIFVASTLPVLFSTLSRLQNNDLEFKKTFFNFQKWVAILILPLGIGIFIFGDLITIILLGNQWVEAVEIVKIWGLMSSIVIVFSYFNSEVYRAKGKPKLSFISQFLHLIFLVPVLLISTNFGFRAIVYARSLVRLQGIFIGFIMLHHYFDISIIKIFKNIMPIIISSLIMGICSWLFRSFFDSYIWDFIVVFISILLYFIILSLFKSMNYEKKIIIDFIYKYKKYAIKKIFRRKK